MNTGRVHDRALLDALEVAETVTLELEVWRVCVTGRDPIRGSSALGRWSPGGSIEVLYTSAEDAGALAEVGFRLSLEPIWPSRISHQIHALGVSTQKTLRFADVAKLEEFGISASRYATFDYGACQALAAAAHFMEYDGLLVPSARHECHNLVIFMDRPAAPTLAIKTSEPVDWEAWRNKSGR